MAFFNSSDNDNLPFKGARDSSLNTKPNATSSSSSTLSRKDSGLLNSTLATSKASAFTSTRSSTLSSPRTSTGSTYSTSTGANSSAFSRTASLTNSTSSTGSTFTRTPVGQVTSTKDQSSSFTSSFSKTPFSSPKTTTTSALTGARANLATSKSPTPSSLSSNLQRTSTPATLSSTTSSRPIAGSTTSASSQSSFTSTRTSSPLSTTLRPTSSSTSTLSTPRSTFTSSTSATSNSNIAGFRANISNDDIAKKLAEAKSALSSVSKVGADGSNVGGLNTNQEVTDVQYRRFAAFIEEKCGIVLGPGKQYLVNSRLSTLLSKFKLLTVDDIINKAMEEKPNNKIQEEVIDAMTTNETLWFRDTYPYLALENIILPELAKRAKYPVRIWSAACSSGQEPYSIAMVIQESLGKMLHVDPKQTQIIGTDLSPEMLSVCRRGQYDAHALSRGLSEERKSKFFKPTHNPNLMQVEHRVKSMVEFRPMNLLGSYALMGRFDVIFCRNVLIYFSNEVKAEILKKLTMCLNPGGYLILGSTETLIGVADKYEMMRCNPGIIYHLKPQKYSF